VAAERPLFSRRLDQSQSNPIKVKWRQVGVNCGKNAGRMTAVFYCGIAPGTEKDRLEACPTLAEGAAGATIAKPGQGEHPNNLFEQKNNMK
jgi:hypothetical protein